MITNDDMDQLFHALAHAVRREILDIVRDTPGLSVGELATHFDISRIAIMNHLSVLSEAQLVISKKDGRKRRLFLNAVPIQEIHERWTDTFSEYWADRMTLVKRAAELAAKNKKKTQEKK